jgi:LTXXQ motif family protein
MFTRVKSPFAVLLLSLFAISAASAQPNKSGAAAPHAAPAPAATAPRAAAPAPHVAAPAPHVAAPAPHIASPRAAPPAHPVAPHIAAPQHYATPRSAQQHAPAVQRAPERATRAAQAPAHTGTPRQATETTQPPAQTTQPSAQRAQVDRLRQQQQQELRAQTGHVAPAQLGELRAQHRQQLEQLQAQQDQARQRAQTTGQSAPMANQNVSRVAPQVAARIAPDTARQGRFAAAFAPRSAQASAEALPNWTAWRLRRQAAFVPWSGALFWPYVYTDMFYYAFWPGAYDEGYWAYAYDDLLDGAYWAYGNPYAAYAYVGPNPETAGLTGKGLPSRASGGRAFAAACEQTASVADWPFAQIETAIAPTPPQQDLLNNLKSAANRAAGMLKSSCPSSFPLTPPGRLQAMTARLEATLAAVDMVRPPLAQFYDSLSDEQKARFNAIGPELGREGVRAANKSEQQAASACGKAKPGLIALPIEQIEAVVRPADGQALDRLRGASDRAVGMLQSACPDAVAQTPTGRLDAMHDRLAAMVDAAKMLQPALNDFYASLDNEQKAAFNTLGRETQSPG